MKEMKEDINLVPPLKWVGGKRKIVEIIISATNKIETPFTYYEPFLVVVQYFFHYTVKAC